MEEKITIKEGLRPLKPDKRDFQYHKVFGAIDPPKEDFLVHTPLKIKQQGNSDVCVGASTCMASEPQEKLPLSMEYQFARIKQIEGSIDSYGSDLRTGAKSAVQYGSLPEKDAPYSLEHYGRDFIANYQNWDNYTNGKTGAEAVNGFTLKQTAEGHKKKSYFKIDETGYQDRFDALRAALWQNRAYKRPILTGCTWRDTWTYAKDGIIPETYEDFGYGHAFCLIGQKTIEGRTYLVAQLSNGTNIGQDGLFYFPREVVNRELKYGNFMFVDEEPEIYKSKNWSFWQRLVDKLLKMIQ